MSYTTFNYSDISIKAFDPANGSSNKTVQSLISSWEQGQAGPPGNQSSISPWLHRAAYKVQFRVKNTGEVQGIEVRLPTSLTLSLEVDYVS
jgi:hypothetical protein